MISIHWFRQDLRVSDNPALTAAARKGAVLPVYIFDTTDRAMGAASRWWLHHSLVALRAALGGLVVLKGDPLVLLPELARRVGASHVFWNRLYDPHAVKRDTQAKADLVAQGIGPESFKAALLFEPWEVKNLSGQPFKVFTPFWRACLKLGVEAPLPAPKIDLAHADGLAVEELGLLPKLNWADGFAALWQPGEVGAQQRFGDFLDHGLSGYATLRDRPDLPHVSRLSPHLHFGEISPRQIWRVMQMREQGRDNEKFLAEIGWREFAAQLMFHFPNLATANWKPEFDDYPWTDDQRALLAWQKGMTGYPFVDAGLRELWATGFMHNRVRMVVASFLIKHLRLDWRQGEAWFWDTLVDADAASNAASWQWVAGSGADAAPYFRIFNPMEQGRKFDPQGAYVRRWCPELAHIPTVYIHAPFEAPIDVLSGAGVQLGVDYPLPMVDHAKARAAALAGYGQVKQSQN